MLAIAVALAVQTAAAANLDNINLLAVTPPTGGNSIVLVNNNDTLTLSKTENTESYWNNFSTLRVGDASAGSMIIDGRDILTTAGAEIGRAATGSVTLTNGATWELNNSLIQIGLEGGTGILNVHNGSKITGIAGLRVGEFYETGEGLLSIDGANSSDRKSVV